MEIEWEAEVEERGRRRREKIGEWDCFLPSFLPAEVTEAEREEEEAPRGRKRQLNCRRPQGEKRKGDLFCKESHLLLFLGRKAERKEKMWSRTFPILPC